MQTGGQRELSILRPKIGRGLVISLLALILSAAFAVLAHQPARAIDTVPAKMNFQGRLTDSSGNIMPDGTYNMKFRIYDAASSGTLQWSEDRAVSASTGVTVTNGLFSVRLGDATPIPADLFDATNLYFEIELPTPATATCSTAACASYSEGPMSPRNPLATSAYSFNSERLDGMDSSEFGQLSANNTFTGANTFQGTTSFADDFGFSGVLYASNFGMAVTVGSGAALDSDTYAFVLDTSTGSSDPASAVNGSMYYNSFLGKFRCYESDTWKDCDTSGTADTSNFAKLDQANTFTQNLTIQDASANQLFTADTSTMTVTVGTSSNGVAFTSNGVVYSGTARPMHRIRLVPEFAGAVLDAGTGSANSGTMTAGFNATNRKNYYRWTTTQVSAQTYDVVVQVPLPYNFDGFATSNPIAVSTYSTNLTNGEIKLELRDSSNGVILNFVSVTPSSTGAWQLVDPGVVNGGTFTAGDYMTLRFRLEADSLSESRLGDITIDYLADY